MLFRNSPVLFLMGRLVKMREYEVKVTSVTTVYVEAESEDEAIEKAGAIYWKQTPDELNCEVVSTGEEG